VVGAGIMGGGIAQMFAEQDKEVILWDANPANLKAGFDSIKRRLRKSVEKGQKPPKIVVEVLDRIHRAKGLQDFDGTQLVIEAVTENMKIKQQLLSELSAALPGTVILATNTSSLSVEALARVVKKPDRFMGMHFFNPPTKLELVEVVPTAVTAEQVVTAVQQLLKVCGKTPITVQDTPGFIVNRLLLLLINEAVRMLDLGVATAEDIDTAMRLGALHPVGPLALADLIGLDTCEAILSTLHGKLEGSSYEPADSLKRRVSTGRLGRKTGEGFFSTKASS
jgi:3-hydroxybutyryl-CoA dehydrogenase